MRSTELEDPSCREARSTIALMAAILVGAGRFESESAIKESQSIYDSAVRQVVKRHKAARGKGKGSYPVLKPVRKK